VSHNVLFICTYNQCRSPTAEHLFADWPGIKTKSAGLGSDAKIPLSIELLDWSNLIAVMEQAHLEELSRRFGSRLNGKRVICLDIPDEYQYMDPILVDLLRQKATHFLPTS
jgi:predicted protein tyrosine phosphatase